MRHNIIEYGASADGSVCTEAIQRAIDLCERGSEVYVPEGTFVTGALFLKSGVTLYLEEGARLLGSGSADDFPIMTYRFEGREQLCYASLINTDGAPYKDITIDGRGTIDANGAALFRQEMAEKKGARGRAVCVRNTENLTIRGVTIRQSPAWCVHLIYCKNVLIENIGVHTRFDENGRVYEGIFNGDGIDIDSCKKVIIRDSFIASQDDCIAVKSGKDAEGRRAGIPSEDIVISGCRFAHGFGVAIGSEMSGGVKDVYVLNCVFENTHSLASIKAVRGRGGYIRNIHYENCTHINRGTEFGDTKWFRGALYAGGFYGEDKFDADLPEPVNEGTPEVNGIYMKNLTVDTTAGNAVYICGLPEAPYKNIFLENVTARGIGEPVIKNTENLKTIGVKISNGGE